MAKKLKLVGVTTNYMMDNSFIKDYGLIDGVELLVEKFRYSQRVMDCCQRDDINAVPILIPPLGEAMLPLLEKLDGLIFTGSPSNVHPNNYGGPQPRPDNIEDKKRDSTTLPMLKMAMERKIPVLCICRGAQELNVAMGGTLHQHIEELPGKMDHRYQYVKGKSYNYGFRAVHDVTVQPGGWLEKIYSKIDPNKKKWLVNSAHGQGVDKLASNLRVEAVADDGVIEAFSPINHDGFFLALQWHPEVDIVIDDPQNKTLFQEFARHL